MIVEVKQLVKTFEQRGTFPWSPVRQVKAVQGVDLQVGPGEIIALVGQSGSGKTTVSRMILGLEEPTSGEIWLDGQRWDGLSESQRRPLRAKFQYVPQDSMSALNPQQTALEHIAETFQVLAGRSATDAKVEARKLLTSLGLSERLHALPREMSGGEQRRVTLARVLALNPKLIVADEPTSGLDPDRRDSVLEALFGNLPKDAGCILVTHDMAEAKHWCNRIYVMLAGRAIEILDLSKNEPQHPYSKLLFDPWGSPLPEKELSKEGCPFHGNCSIVLQSKCTQSLPQLTSLSNGHSVACHALCADSSQIADLDQPKDKKDKEDKTVSPNAGEAP